MKVRYNCKEPGFCQAPFLQNRLLLKSLFVCLFGLSGCVANSTTIDKNLPKDIQFHVHTNVQQQPLSLDVETEGTLVEIRSNVVSQHQNLTLDVVKIEDSRCAIGETCIWAGQLLVTLEVSDNHNQAVEIKLLRRRKAEMVFTLGYGFRLLNVEPHPRKDKKIQFSEQVVQIEIVKIANST